MMTGTPGRLGITITGPVSACAGATGEADSPEAAIATIVSARNMKSLYP
jgi:hypothetical protein